MLRVVRYTKEWERLDSVSLYGANTVEPFYAGSLRMVQGGDLLYIHTCHKMYTSAKDGKNHQANLHFSVHIPTMTARHADYLVSAYVGYASHSFNQFVLTDEAGQVHYLDHGDAYPRAVSMDGYPVLDIQGSIGANDTGVSIGGFAYSDANYLICGNSVDQSSAETYNPFAKRNIFVAACSRNTHESKIRWITDYTDSNDAEISTPQLVKMASDRFLLLWTEDEDLKYVFLDGDGNRISEIYEQQNSSLSDCQPILYQDKALWYVSSEEGLYFYEIDMQGNYEEERSYGLERPVLRMSNTQAGFLAQWTETADAQRYILCYRRAGDESMYRRREIRLTDSNVQQRDGVISVSVDGFADGTRYEFWVYAYTEEMKSPASEPETILRFMPRAENASEGIRLSWVQVPDAAQYIIYRKTEEGSYLKAAEAEGNEWTDTEVKSGGQYWYKVVAEDEKPEQAAELALVYLKAPTVKEVRVKYASVSGTVYSNFRIVWDSVPGAAGYRVYLSRKGAAGSGGKRAEAEAIAGQPEMSADFIYESYRENQEYEFFVEACIEDKSSARSNPVSCMTDKSGEEIAVMDGTGYQNPWEYRKPDEPFNPGGGEDNGGNTGGDDGGNTGGDDNGSTGGNGGGTGSGNKNPDSAVHAGNNTVTGSGAASDNAKAKPKGTSISGKVKAKRKGFTVKWKKRKNVSGYQIMYSTNKKFPSSKTRIKTIAKGSVTKWTAKKLEAGKKYYVKVRTYQKMKGKNFYAKWSKVKSVTTKK